MYTAELIFECYQDTTLDAVNHAITGLIDALRYNGQILGREFPTTVLDGQFVTRVVCPEEDSLHARNHSAAVSEQLKALSQAGILAPRIKITGMDLHSDNTDPCTEPNWQILYTHYLSTCSPLRCGDHFAPIPLYKLPLADSEADHQELLRWQVDWTCCDELQMHGTTLAAASTETLTDISSSLNETGRHLSQQIERNTAIPTYYYLYHLGRQDKAQELSRKCPGCGGEWRQEPAIYGIFDFKCDPCRLLSNLPWDLK